MRMAMLLLGLSLIWTGSAVAEGAWNPDVPRGWLGVDLQYAHTDFRDGIGEHPGKWTDYNTDQSFEPGNERYAFYWFDAQWGPSKTQVFSVDLLVPLKSWMTLRFGGSRDDFHYDDTWEDFDYLSEGGQVIEDQRTKGANSYTVHAYTYRVGLKFYVGGK